MVQQYVALLHRFEHIGAVRHLARPGGRKRRPAQFRLSQQVDQLIEANQVDRPIDLKHRRARNLKLFLQ